MQGKPKSKSNHLLRGPHYGRITKSWISDQTCRLSGWSIAKKCVSDDRSDSSVSTERDYHFIYTIFHILKTKEDRRKCVGNRATRNTNDDALEMRNFRYLRRHCVAYGTAAAAMREICIFGKYFVGSSTHELCGNVRLKIELLLWNFDTFSYWFIQSIHSKTIFFLFLHLFFFHFSDATAMRNICPLQGNRTSQV